MSTPIFSAPYDFPAHELYTFEQWLAFVEPQPHRVQEMLSTLVEVEQVAELRAVALAVLHLREPDEKLTAMRALYLMGQNGLLHLNRLHDRRNN